MYVYIPTGWNVDTLLKVSKVAHYLFMVLPDDKKAKGKIKF